MEQQLTFTDDTAIHILKLYPITYHPTPDTDIGPQFPGNAIAILSQFQLRSLQTAGSPGISWLVSTVIHRLDLVV
jgi:hypothetical protein